MKTSMKKLTCRVLVVSLMTLSLQTARAGLISAEQAAPASASAERALILNTLDRSEVAAQLQAAGVDPQSARDRVAAMTDQEARTLAQDIQTAPAGALSTAGWIAVVAIVALVWYFAYRK
jgi:hypothetical protein